MNFGVLKNCTLKPQKFGFKMLHFFSCVFLGLYLICIFYNSLETVHFLWICKSSSYVMKIYHLSVMQTIC